MNWLTGFIVYFLIWWLVIFTVLPFGVRRDESGPEITAPGAPEHPRMGVKFLVTTILSFVIWGVVYALIESDLISFREMAAAGIADKD